MTPLDRYRKHYLMFDYWNGELIQALQSPPLNPKRLARTSTDALAELETLQRLLTDELAARLAPLLEERARMNQQLKSGSFSDSQASMIPRLLEAQTRQIHREFFWRNVQESLKSATPTEALASP